MNLKQKTFLGFFGRATGEGSLHKDKKELKSHIEEELPNKCGNAQIFSHMRRPVVIYDFATAPF